MASTAKNKKQLNTELVAGSNALSGYLRTLKAATMLPLYIDDVERDYQLTIYTRMLNDPAVHGAVKALKKGVMVEGPRFVNRVAPPSPFKPDPVAQAAHEKADEIRDECERMCDNLQQPLEDILGEMMDFLPYGHKLAEKVYTLGDNGLVALSVLRAKPREAYSFALTGTNDFLGVIAAKPGLGGAIVNVGQEITNTAEIIDRSKLFILTNDGLGGDPRGQSILRPAYNSWYQKQQAWPAYLKFLIQFGTPSLIGILPPGVNSTDSVGTGDDATTAATTLATQMLAFANGTVIVLENGGSIEVVQCTGDGAAFREAINLNNREMQSAILISPRAVSEAQYGSRADSDTASDVVGQYVQSIRRRVEMAFYRDVIQPWVWMNWGPEAASDLSPFLSLSDSSPGDVTALGSMIAQLAGQGLIQDDQLPDIYVSLGLPATDIEAMMRKKAEDAAQAKEIAHNAYGVGGIPPEPDVEAEDEAEPVDEE